ncbi:MAG: DUF362 domain-containing protein [Nitrososphaerales archaeon]
MKCESCDTCLDAFTHENLRTSPLIGNYLPGRVQSRREFLKWGAAWALGIGLSAFVADEVAERVYGVSDSPQPRSKVSIAKGEELEDITREAIDLLGGIRSVIDPGDKVFIKPNFVGFGGYIENVRDTVRNGQCTKLEVVHTVAEECLKTGASKVTIGEGGQGIMMPWEGPKTLDGKKNMPQLVAELNETYGVKVSLKALNAATPYWVFIPSMTDLRKIAVPSFAMEADKVISIPVVKTHHSYATTLGMKNFVGITPVSLYGTPRVRLHGSDPGMPQVIIDLTKGLQPDLAVIDCSIGAEGQAPAVPPGETVNVKERIGGYLMIASRDFLAADATATRVIGHNPDWIKYMRWAYEQNVGQKDEDKIEVVGEPVESVQMNWKPAETSGYPQI